jgi:hypothetical protein
MGLLDDAIREHLELKRRRGADPAEVEKQEREALGPVGAAAAVEEHAPAVVEEPPDDVAREEPPHAAVYDDDPDPFEDAHAAHPPDAPRPAAGPDREPEPEPEQPTREDEPAGEEGEDVLDETPEFLQEAPEHDRLWFEQRPPRDFDF